MFDFVSDSWEQVFFVLFSEDPWNSSGQTADESSSRRRVCVCMRVHLRVRVYAHAHCTGRAGWRRASVPVHLICLRRALLSFLIN